MNRNSSIVTSDYYKTLDVNPTATQGQIRQAYRHLVKLFHPDTHTEVADHERIISINEAYEVLKGFCFTYLYQFYLCIFWIRFSKMVFANRTQDKAMVMCSVGPSKHIVSISIDFIFLTPNIMVFI